MCGCGQREPRPAPRKRKATKQPQNLSGERNVRKPQAGRQGQQRGIGSRCWLRLRGKDRATHMDEGGGRAESGGRRPQCSQVNCLISCKCLVQRKAKGLEQAELPTLVPGIAHFCCQPHPNRAVSMRMHLSNAASAARQKRDFTQSHARPKSVKAHQAW